jgi:hypothetical protein
MFVMLPEELYVVSDVLSCLANHVFVSCLWFCPYMWLLSSKEQDHVSIPPFPLCMCHLPFICRITSALSGNDVGCLLLVAMMAGKHFLTGRWVRAVPDAFTSATW